MKFQENGWKVIDKPFVVYMHLQNDEVRYIGYGHPGRPFEKEKSQCPFRSIEVRNRTATVLKYYNNEEEARRDERRLIHKYHPPGNAICYVCARDKAVLCDDALRLWRKAEIRRLHNSRSFIID